MVHYWRIRTRNPGGTDTYIKTNDVYFPAMIVDIAVRQKMFCDAFVDCVESVVEVTQEEYLTYMWD